MKLVVFKDVMTTGRGADRAVAMLVNLLARAGHDVTLILGQRDVDTVSCYLTSEIKIKFLPLPKRSLFAKLHLSNPERSYARTLKQLLSELAPDVVISAGTHELYLLALDGMPTIPIIQQVHVAPNKLFKPKQKAKNRILRAAFDQLAAVQILLPYQEAQLHELFPTMQCPVAVIGNTSTYLLEPIKQEISYQPIILYPAALNADKNQSLLINAFAQVADEFPQWSVHLYGKGAPDYTERLQQQVLDLKLGQRVIFKGYVADLAPAYATCAFIAFPSRTEGFGLILLDAAAFNKPTIGLTSTPAIAALIEDNKTGLLTDDAHFAEKLRVLMTSSIYCEDLGTNPSIKRHYMPRAILQSWEALLTQVKR